MDPITIDASQALNEEKKAQSKETRADKAKDMAVKAAPAVAAGGIGAAMILDDDVAPVEEQTDDNIAQNSSAQQPAQEEAVAEPETVMVDPNSVSLNPEEDVPVVEADNTVAPGSEATDAEIIATTVASDEHQPMGMGSQHLTADNELEVVPLEEPTSEIGQMIAADIHSASHDEPLTASYDYDDIVNQIVDDMDLELEPPLIVENDFDDTIPSTDGLADDYMDMQSDLMA